MILGLLLVAMLCNIAMSCIHYKEGNNEAALPWFVLFVVSFCEFIALVVR